jgi:hypothetical protein
MAGTPGGPNNQQGGYRPRPYQQRGGNNYGQQPRYPDYPQQPQPGRPRSAPVGGNYPRGPYPGAPVAQPAPYPQQYGNPNQPYGATHPQAGQTPGLVTAGFVLSLFGCTSMPGIICCAMGMAEAKRRQAGEGLAIAGIVIGILWQVAGTILYIAASAAG